MKRTKLSMQVEVPASTMAVATGILLGKTYSEIATFLGVTEAAVSQHKSKALVLGLITEQDANAILYRRKAA